MRASFLVLAILFVCCSDDETTVVATATTSASSTASTGGSGGSGGTLGECPAMPAGCEACESVDLVCGAGDVCCICANIDAQIRWACADPTANDASCPAAEPVANQPCQAVGTTCSYCDNGTPKQWACAQRGWTAADFVCP